jgi:hypothetical protein
MKAAPCGAAKLAALNGHTPADSGAAMKAAPCGAAKDHHVGFIGQDVSAAMKAAPCGAAKLV